MQVFQNALNADVYVDADGAGTAPATLLLTINSISATDLTDAYFLFQ